MNPNCVDYPCKHRADDCTADWCSLHQSIIPDDIDTTGCSDFELARTCLDCKHRKETVFETGTIDDIEYRCEFQGNKLIYDDLDVYNKHYSDIPECNCSEFELNIEI